MRLPLYNHKLVSHLIGPGLFQYAVRHYGQYKSQNDVGELYTLLRDLMVRLGVNENFLVGHPQSRCNRRSNHHLYIGKPITMVCRRAGYPGGQFVGFFFWLSGIDLTGGQLHLGASPLLNLRMPPIMPPSDAGTQETTLDLDSPYCRE